MMATSSYIFVHLKEDLKRLQPLELLVLRTIRSMEKAQIPDFIIHISDLQNSLIKI